jgi:lincosamide nucleotidyltransferase A/C/D/E
MNEEIVNNMEASEVVGLYRLLEENGITVHVDGGWGIDALLGQQTRRHNDLDIAVQHKDVPRLRELLSQRGYLEVARPDTQEYCFVLGDARGHEVDVHSYTFDSAGNNIYGIAYPAASLTGEGTISGYLVKCIQLEWVIRFHENYEPDEDDVRDIRALCERFGCAPPKNYKDLR